MLRPKFGICMNCNKEKPIVNIRYGLCQECNYNRLHPGEKKKIYQLKQTKLNPLSKKKKRQYQSYERQKREKWIFEEVVLCTGCGSSKYLSSSHLIPRSQNESLIDDHNNFVSHCMERIVSDEFGYLGCHDRWESKNPKKLKTLLDLENNLNYIKKVDINYYEYLISILNED